MCGWAAMAATMAILVAFIQKQKHNRYARHCWYKCLLLLFPARSACFCLLPAAAPPMASENEVDATGQVCKEIRRLSRASGALDKQDMLKLYKNAEVAKDVMLAGVKDFILEAEHLPCMRSTASDDTPPITVSEMVASQLGDSAIIRRGGKACHEFQVGLSMYRCIEPDVNSRIVLREAMPMRHGKTAAAEWEIVKHAAPTLRSAGHLGEVVEHYAWDRAKFGALQRMAKAWHNAEVHAGTERLSSHRLGLTQFVVCTPCACHDANKAQEWSMLSEFRDKDLLRDVFVAIASLRQTWNLISQYLSQWICLRMECPSRWRSMSVMSFSRCGQRSVSIVNVLSSWPTPCTCASSMAPFVFRQAVQAFLIWWRL